MRAYLAGVLIGMCLCLGQAHAGDTADGSGEKAGSSAGQTVKFRSDAAESTVSVSEMAIALLATLGVGIAGILVLKRLWPPGWGGLPVGAGQRLRVSGRLVLGPRCVVHLVDVDGRERFLVAQTGHSVVVTPCAGASASGNLPVSDVGPLAD